MTVDIGGRSVAITGACGGIGTACASLLAGMGACLTLVDRSADGLEALARSLGSADFQSLTLDVTNESDMQRMAQAAVERFGRVDVLIAAAGILRSNPQPTPVVDTTFDEWRSIIDINLTGIFLSNRAVLPAMLKGGGGDIVNISSTSGRQGRAFDAAYCASKFGVVGFSESLAEEVGRLGIRVQTLLPDAVDTPIWAQSGSAALKPQTMLPPERVAQFVHYLITLPRDTYLLNPTIYPLRSRARRAPPAGSRGDASAND